MTHPRWQQRPPGSNWGEFGADDRLGRMNLVTPQRSSTLGVAHGHAGAALPLHEHCLFKLGVHLGELWYLTELAQWLREHARNRFLLTAPPLRLPGAAGSPVMPVATV